MTCEDYDERNGPGIVEKVARQLAPLLDSRPIRALARLLPQDIRLAVIGAIVVASSRTSTSQEENFGEFAWTDRLRQVGVEPGVLRLATVLCAPETGDGDQQDRIASWRGAHAPSDGIAIDTGKAQVDEDDLRVYETDHFQTLLPSHRFLDSVAP